MALVSIGSREQLQRIHWEQFITSDNPVRVIDAFVDLLDLEQLGSLSKVKAAKADQLFCPEMAFFKPFLFFNIQNRLISDAKTSAPGGLIWAL